MQRRGKLSIPDSIVIAASIGLGLVLVLAIHEVSRRRAKELGCMANLRQWGDIFQGYVERNEGNFISSDVWYWIKELNDEHKDRHKMEIWFCPRADKPRHDENRNVLRESFINSAWGIEMGYDFGPTGMAGSYGLNGYALNIRTRGKSTKLYWRTPNVEGSAHIPLFIDALRFDLSPEASDSPPEEREHNWSMEEMDRACIDRHQGGVNCLFMDWSVRKVGLKELWTLKWHREFDAAGPWTKAGGVQPSDWPEWMRSFKDY